MARVYLADDLRHGRNVALKVLRPEVAEAVGSDRFLSEIRTTAALKHPHILPLFDSGDADGHLFYVMPHIDGDTLRDRLDREGPLPVEEAVGIARDVAAALDYAHRQGVVHRDVKPANILLVEGRPVVADFGIALAVGSDGHARLTETGVSLGTPHYMSPEQTTGDGVLGPATDLYALGCVTYEMLVGEPPFTGSSAAAVLGKIVAAEPESVTAQRRSVPRNVDAAVAKALEKLPADRFQRAADFAAALADPTFRHGEGAAALSAAAARWKRVAAGAGVVAAAMVGLWLSGLSEPEEPRPVRYFSLGEGQSLAQFRSFDIAPDGSFFVYQGPRDRMLDVTSGAGFELWMRDLSRREPVPISSTGDGASLRPAISPDQTEVAVMRGGTGRNSIHIVPLGDGVRRTIAEDGDYCCDMTWSPDGRWFYYPTEGGLVRVPAAAGGIPEPVTRIEPGSDARHGSLEVLPEGDKGVFVTWRGFWEDPTITGVDLQSGETREIGPGLRPRYRDGYLVYAVQEMQADSATLMAAPFDTDALEFTAPPVPVLEGLAKGRYTHVYASLSQTGTLLYLTGGTSFRFEPVWVSRDGTVEVIDREWYFGSQWPWFTFELSADDRRLVASSLRPGANIDMRLYDLWLKDLDTGERRQIATDADRNILPVWFGADSVIYLRQEVGGAGPAAPYVADVSEVDQARPLEEVLGLEESLEPLSRAVVTPDGDWLVYATSGAPHDIFALDLGRGAAPRPVAAAGYHEGSPALSPDGRWLAYESDRSGALEVYVQPFPGGGEVVRVSEAGGFAPVWDGTGRELFYWSAEGYIVAVDVTLGETFRVGASERLFETSMYYGQGRNEGLRPFDVTSDGQRFVMARRFEVRPQELVRIENFMELVKAAFRD